VSGLFLFYFSSSNRLPCFDYSLKDSKSKKVQGFVKTAIFNMTKSQYGQGAPDGFPRSMKIIPLVLLVCCLAACSAKQVYEGGMGMERSKCAQGPANEYRNCMERSDMSYEEYEAARKEADGGN